MIKGTARAFVAVAMLLVTASAVPAQQPQDSRPKRIVSFNLCADQLLLALADPDQIAGLSPYAANPSLSVMSAQAAPFPKLDWDAESVVNLGPDLVLIGPRSNATRSLLERLGVRVGDVGLVSDFAAAQAQAREIGRLVGHPARGEALASALARAEAELVAAAPRVPRTALVIERGGYAEGPQSLIAAMLSAANLKPPNSALGLGGFVSLEQLLVDAPDILVMKDPPSEAADQGALFITHPALRARYPETKRIAFPARYALCGGPALQQGLVYLARAITALEHDAEKCEAVFGKTSCSR